MNEFMETKEALLIRLDADEVAGLTETQVEKSRQLHGTNTLTQQKSESILQRIWNAATEPMIIMLIMAGIIALAVNIIQTATGGEDDILECVGIFAAISLSVIITVIMEGKSAKAFEALSQISDNALIKAIRNGNTVMLNQEDIVSGDILQLVTGDKIPADGRLLESVGLTADESALTGESVPAKKSSEFEIADEKTPLAERANMLYRGNFITNGYCKMVVTAVGDATEFGKIARELTESKQSSTPLQEKLARLGKTITILGGIAAAIVFYSPLL